MFDPSSNQSISVLQVIKQFDPGFSEKRNNIKLDSRVFFLLSFDHINFTSTGKENIFPEKQLACELFHVGERCTLQIPSLFS